MTEEVDIKKWAELAKIDWKSLLLGNGASVALHSGFCYTSLHGVAKTSNSLPTTDPLFAEFGTTDFESVLLACWHAHLVNSALDNPSPEVDAAYEEVRSALIDAVIAVHPDHSTIQDSLERVGKFASDFETVVTLNYDITLYWAMMLFNESNGQWFKDAFLHQEFEPTWQWLRSPYGGTKGATIVFYGHGSLILGRNVLGGEVKLAATVGGVHSDLLTTIAEAWTAGTHVPLFVSEGDSASKLAAIRRSPYLSAVYNAVLTELGERVVVYGLSFSANDKHILNALKKKPPQLMAVSVYTGQAKKEQQSYAHRVLAQTKRLLPTTHVVFFDSASPGCWNNP